MVTWLCVLGQNMMMAGICDWQASSSHGGQEPEDTGTEWSLLPPGSTCLSKCLQPSKTGPLSDPKHPRHSLWGHSYPCRNTHVQEAVLNASGVYSHSCYHSGVLLRAQSPWLLLYRVDACREASLRSFWKKDFICSFWRSKTWGNVRGDGQVEQESSSCGSTKQKEVC